MTYVVCDRYGCGGQAMALRSMHIDEALSR